MASASSSSARSARAPRYLVHELAPIADASRRHWYAARVLGAWNEDGLWDGYIEFTSESGRVVVTPRETRQPNVADLVYWSTGLTPIYLEGALERAREAAARARRARAAERLTPRRQPSRPSRARASASRTRRVAGARARHR
ncbi:MAG: hypothetical protein KF819_23400 [Labilithrix sp.]|nr:hypothetical protein [Labilithrix sp.]